MENGDWGIRTYAINEEAEEVMSALSVLELGQAAIVERDGRPVGALLHYEDLELYQVLRREEGERAAREASQADTTAALRETKGSYGSDSGSGQDEEPPAGAESSADSSPALIGTIPEDGPRLLAAVRALPEYGAAVAVERHGKRVAALIPYEDFELYQRLFAEEEDRLDHEAARAARAEGGEPVTIQEFMAQQEIRASG